MRKGVGDWVPNTAATRSQIAIGMRLRCSWNGVRRVSHVAGRRFVTTVRPSRSNGKPPGVTMRIATANIDEVARTTKVAPLIPIGCASKIRSPAASRRSNSLKTLACSWASTWSG